MTSHLSVNALLAPQLQSLVDDGWDVHVVCAPGPIDPAPLATATVHFIAMSRAMSPVRDMRSVVEMWRLLRRLRPVAVVGSTPKAALVAMLAGLLARVRTRIFQVRGARWDGMTGAATHVLVAADRVTAMSATHVVAVSNSLADLMLEHRAVRRRPTVLGHGGSKGVDVVMFRPDPTHRFDPASPTLGFVGRLTSDKGIDDALQVLDRVRSGGAAATLEVIGDADHAQPVDAATLDGLRHRPEVTWFPELTAREVAGRMAAWDLLLFPSRREGLPNAVIEAASAGVPTIGYDTTGVRDAVADRTSGLLVPLDDVDALYTATRAALDLPEHQRLSDGARAWALEAFDSRVVQQRFADFVRRAVADTHGSS